jgi:hypothetical protein
VPGLIRVRPGSLRSSNPLGQTAAFMTKPDYDYEKEQASGHYLAGLIEGDGSIYVPEQARSEKGILLYPVIFIEFALKDLPLAKKIIELFF